MKTEPIQTRFFKTTTDMMVISYLLSNRKKIFFQLEKRETSANQRFVRLTVSSTTNMSVNTMKISHITTIMQEQCN